MLNTAPFVLEGRRTLLLADRSFSAVDAKTAVCYLMYRPAEVVAVLDSTKPGRTVSQVVGFGGNVPIVATVADSMALRPEVAIVGTAPMGGALDTALREQVAQCLSQGMDVVSGLHTFLADDEEIKEIARARGGRIWDARKVSDDKIVSTGVGCTTGAKTVLLVGSDCNVGKMTATIELHREAVRRGKKAAWAATGQTGIMLRGRGIAVDRVVSDFVGGAAETLVNHEGAGMEIIFVEGQGSIVHPGYAGVSVGLLFGVMPDCMVLAHTADRDHFKRLAIPMPPLKQLVDLHEQLMRPFRESRVVAVALNTSMLSPGDARSAVRVVERETGLPATDPVRDGAGRIMDAIEGALS